jgi:hypothetical protein
LEAPGGLSVLGGMGVEGAGLTVCGVTAEEDGDHDAAASHASLNRLCSKIGSSDS